MCGRFLNRTPASETARLFGTTNPLPINMGPVGLKGFIAVSSGKDRVVGMSERAAGTHYFDWHHSEADTLDKVNPEDFRKSVAALAVMSFAVADMPARLIAAAGARRGQ